MFYVKNLVNCALFCGVKTMKTEEEKHGSVPASKNWRDHKTFNYEGCKSYKYTLYHQDCANC